MLNCAGRRQFVARGGYALVLGLLVVFILGMIVYWTRMHGDVVEIGVGKSDINPPWRQWHKMKVRYRIQCRGRVDNDKRREELQAFHLERKGFAGLRAGAGWSAVWSVKYRPPAVVAFSGDKWHRRESLSC